MIGSIVPLVTGVMPGGVLVCDGATHARVSYPDLYAVLDAVFIVDADTFVTPDLRGLALVGSPFTASSVLYGVGDTVGDSEHVLLENEMPAHEHDEHQHLPDVDADRLGAAPFPAPGLRIPGTTGVTGGGDGHNNVQPSFVVRWGVVAA